MAKREHRRGSGTPARTPGAARTVRDIMSPDVACCTPETSLRDVAAIMVEHDCGEVPVVEDRESLQPIGVVTDRDIVCRVIAEGLNPLDMKASDCMSAPAVTVSPDDDVDECSHVMATHRIRRVPVVDEHGACCGIVAQADLATKGPQQAAAGMVREVSQPG